MAKSLSTIEAEAGTFIPDNLIREVSPADVRTRIVDLVDWLEENVVAGGSTGTGLWSALKIVAEMVAEERTGSVVTLICDPGDRYLDKYYSDAWLAEQGLDIAPYAAAVTRFLETGVWPE